MTDPGAAGRKQERIARTSGGLLASRDGVGDERSEDRSFFDEVRRKVADDRAAHPHRTTVLWQREAHGVAMFRPWCVSCYFLVTEKAHKAALERLAREHERSWRQHEMST